MNNSTKNKRYTRVCLFQPPAILVYGASKTVWPPLGLLYLAATLRDAYEVEYFDSILEGFDDFNVWDHDTHLMGLSPDKCVDRIISTGAHVLAISLQFENQIAPTLQILKKLKAADNQIFVLAGGPIATLKSKQVFEVTEIDGIIVGEGEYKVVEYMERLNNSDWSGLKAAGIKLGNDKIINLDYKPISEQDKIPFPARDMADMERYFSVINKFKMLPKRRRATTMLSSRGCPEKCIFCASTVLYNRRYKARSAENVVAEIEHLVSDFGVEEVIFFDENFAVDKRRVIRFLDLLIEKRLGISWYCSQGFAQWTIDNEIIEKMAESGCYKIKFSIESGSQRVLDSIILKKVDLKRTPEIIQKCKDVGLVTGANFILGFPGETRDDIQKTYDFAKLIDVDFTIFNVAMPYPQTELQRLAKKLGFLPDDWEWNSLAPGIAYMNNPEFTKHELEHWYHQFWKVINFSTPERAQRYYQYAIPNPSYVPITKPS